MHGLLTDLRQTPRGFRREPGFTAIAVLALAIGVGASTAMFSVIDAALIGLDQKPATSHSTGLRGDHVVSLFNIIHIFNIRNAIVPIYALGWFGER